mgnify:CR=1 FL=1
MIKFKTKREKIFYIVTFIYLMLLGLLIYLCYVNKKFVSLLIILWCVYVLISIILLELHVIELKSNKGNYKERN